MVSWFKTEVETDGHLDGQTDTTECSIWHKKIYVERLLVEKLRCADFGDAAITRIWVLLFKTLPCVLFCVRLN